MADFLHPSLQRDIKRFCLRYGLNVSHAYHTPTDFWNDEGAGGQAVFVCLLHQMPFGEAFEAGKGCTATFPERPPCGLQAAGKELDISLHIGSGITANGWEHIMVCTDRFMRHGGIEGVIHQLGVVPLRRDVFWGGGIGAVWIV